MKKLSIIIALSMLLSCSKQDDKQFIQDYITQKTLGTVTDAKIYNVVMLNDSTYTATYEHENIMTRNFIKLDVILTIENVEGKKVVKSEETKAFYVLDKGEFKEIKKD